MAKEMTAVTAVKTATPQNQAAGLSFEVRHADNHVARLSAE
jgi:hypothetical protein